MAPHMTRLPPSISPVRFRRGDVELDQPHADPEREQRNHAGQVVGYHEIRTARVRSGHGFLFARGTIERDHWLVGERFVEVTAASQGVREGEWIAAGRLSPHQQGHPCTAMVEALTLLRRADAQVGKPAMAIVAAVCRDGVTLSDLAAVRGEPDRQIVGRLKAALERLGEVWGMSSRVQRRRYETA